MCIAILNTPNVTFDKALISNCWNNNPDGAGLIWTDTKRKTLHIYKELKSVNAYFNKYQEIKRAHPKTNIVLHFRISTSGGVNEQNCHPFNVTKNLAFVHNGIISDLNGKDAKRSDTNLFNRDILQHLPSGFLNNASILSLITKFIGAGSKLIFLDNNNTPTIVNPNAGQTDKDYAGCWFSNGTYKATNYYDRGGVKVWKNTGYTAPTYPPVKKDTPAKLVNFKGYLVPENEMTGVYVPSPTKDQTTYAKDEAQITGKYLQTYDPKTGKTSYTFWDKKAEKWLSYADATNAPECYVFTKERATLLGLPQSQYNPQIKAHEFFIYDKSGNAKPYDKAESLKINTELYKDTAEKPKAKTMENKVFKRPQTPAEWRDLYKEIDSVTDATANEFWDTQYKLWNDLRNRPQISLTRAQWEELEDLSYWFEPTREEASEILSDLSAFETTGAVYEMDYKGYVDTYASGKGWGDYGNEWDGWENY